MNFLVDAQLPRQLVTLLRQAGYDAIHQTSKGDRRLQAAEEFGIVREHDKYSFLHRLLLILSAL